MFRLSIVLSLLAVMPVSKALPEGTPPPQSNSQEPLRAVMESAISKVKPALVRIHVVSVNYSEGRETKNEAYGSGVIISADGYVITNHHVAGDAKYITCALANKEEMEADLVGTDALTDIAVIKLRPPVARKFQYAEFGDSSVLKVGDRVLAMGSPLAFSQSVTMGVISNTELVMPDNYPDQWLTLDGEDVGSIVRWIAHDAPIYPGNSGGPLVDMNGRIIGINEIDLGLSGAIPGNLAKEVSDQIIKSKKVIRSWIGITVQPLLSSQSQRKGILVTGTVPGSPASAAGFKPGDILVSIAGKPVDVHFKEEMPLFNHMVMNLPAGVPIDAIVSRSGHEVSLKVTPNPRPNATEKPQEFKEWGFCVSNITTFEAKEMRRSSTHGVRVCSMRPGGPADSAKPSMQQGDIIVQVAGKPVSNLTDFQAVMQGIIQGKATPVPATVAFERGEERYLTVVKVGIQDEEDHGKEITKAWLPVGTQVLTTDLAEALGLEGRTGVRITQVYPGTSAARAKLQVGDIIVAVDGNPVEASEPEDTEVFPAMIRQYRINSTAELTVHRDGRDFNVSVQLPAAPKPAREMKKYRDRNYDFSMRDIAFMDRVRQEWPESKQGVIVESVGEGGWAAMGRLSSGDLITAVDGTPISSVNDLEAEMKTVAAVKPKSIVLQVERGIHSVFIELKAAWSPTGL